jgi:hypothetical protein
LLEIVRDVGDDRALAEQVCWAYVAGLDVDGAAIYTADRERRAPGPGNSTSATKI